MAQKKYPDPNDSKLPLAFRWLLANKLYSFYPWYLIRERSEAEALRQEFIRQSAESESAVRDVLPIARRDDGFDIAAFVVEDGTIRDTLVVCEILWNPEKQGAGAKAPRLHQYNGLWEWLSRSVLKDTRQWISEENLKDLAALKL